MQSNPEFTAQVAAAAADGKAVILACEAGGSITASTSFATGKASRSLKAAWRVLYTQILPADKVMHLEGGVVAWYQAGLPMVGEYNASNAYKTPAGVSSSGAAPPPPGSS